MCTPPQKCLDYHTFLYNMPGIGHSRQACELVCLILGTLLNLRPLHPACPSRCLLSRGGLGGAVLCGLRSGGRLVRAIGRAASLAARLPPLMRAALSRRRSETLLCGALGRRSVGDAGGVLGSPRQFGGEHRMRL